MPKGTDSPNAVGNAITERPSFERSAVNSMPVIYGSIPKSVALLLPHDDRRLIGKLDNALFKFLSKYAD